MVVVESNATLENVECPVLKEWLKVEVLVARGVKGKVAECRSQSFSRLTVADNYELLIPLVTHVGTSPSNKTMAMAWW